MRLILSCFVLFLQHWLNSGWNPFNISNSGARGSSSQVECYREAVYYLQYRYNNNFDISNCHSLCFFTSLIPFWIYLIFLLDYCSKVSCIMIISIFANILYCFSADTTVCDELLLGIPHKAWWVVILALLCLGIAFMIPSFLPSYLLPKNPVSRSDDRPSKTS